MPILLTALLLAGQLAPANEAADKASVAALSAADRSAIFKAAGATMTAGTWRMCADGDDPATIETARDINGDGRPEALITEGGTACYGDTGQGYALVSKQADGRWRLLDQQTGVAQFLTSKGVGGYPDIEVGGPGFCFPKERWNGNAYKVVGNSYDGKPCKSN